jgi:uncharacterized protein
MIKKITTFLPRLFIKIYQQTVSPDHGWFAPLFPPGFCRFHPSCSQYGYDAFTKYGLIKGGYLTLWRILRCNPFNPGGNDPA